MTNGQNYDGAEESIRQLITIGKKIYRFYKGPEIPKDPHEAIALLKKLQNDEKVSKDGEEARRKIREIYKKRDREARLARRAKIKKLFGKKS